MYQTIYELLNKTGLIKSAVILNGRERAEMHFEQGKLHCTVRPGNGLETVSPCDFRGRRNEGDFRRRYEDISRAVRKKSAPCDSRGGHVSCPVAHIAKMLDFHVTVMDDRKEFLTKTIPGSR